MPNTTPMPHIIIREWMPRLKDVELRVLLVITDQTLGWIEDKLTGRRKEKDWISRGQLMQKTGRGHSSVSVAIEALAQYGVIEAYDEKARRLKTPKERSGNKVFYRLNLAGALPVDKHVDIPKPVQKVDGILRGPVQNLDVQNLDTTKSTDIQKRFIEEPKLTKTQQETNRLRFLKMRHELAQKLTFK